MELDAHIASRVKRGLPRGAAICVGLSGGLDSVTLLDLLARAAPTLGHAVRAVHVHHGLSPNADAWAAFCERMCADRGIALDVVRVRVPGNAPEGLEAAARAGRYAVYAGREEPIVALAHHLDDQAETVLLQLLRGTGLKGLAAMPELRALEGGRVSVFRPLIDIPRAALQAHSTARGLSWIEDESNGSLRHDRNFIRHDVAPRLDARFAGWKDAASRCARHAGSAMDLLGELARIDGAPLRPGQGLELAADLSPARRANALRAFLAIEGLPMPSEARLAEMARQLYGARGDARVRIAHGGATLVRQRGVALALVDAIAACADDWRVAWHGEALVELGPGRGSVRFELAMGKGLSTARHGDADWHFARRRGGERLRLEASRPSRTLKNLFQEAAVPEWERERLPLLFRGERLAWVPGIGVAADFACAPGMPGTLPAWSPEGEKRSPD
jgi:tRNA(Ile)-lysidine synthase